MAMTKKHPLAHAASLLPLAIGLTMTGVSSKGPISKTTSSNGDVCEELGIDASASDPFTQVILPPTRECTVRMSNGFPIPDASCTPGAIDSTVTEDVLKDSRFRTSCIRNRVTSNAKKNTTYDWYKIDHPDNNTGQTQTCELDHLVPLELGGADTLNNIWPQCGPPGVPLSERYFKRKDAIENFLTAQVKAGKISLSEAQRGIAADWTQYLGQSENCGDDCE
jgi:hypothetical protein